MYPVESPSYIDLLDDADSSTPVSSILHNGILPIQSPPDKSNQQSKINTRSLLQEGQIQTLRKSSDIKDKPPIFPKTDVVLSASLENIIASMKETPPINPTMKYVPSSIVKIQALTSAESQSSYKASMSGCDSGTSGTLDQGEKMEVEELQEATYEYVIALAAYETIEEGHYCLYEGK